MIWVELYLWLEVGMLALGVIIGPQSAESARNVASHPHTFRLVRLGFFVVAMFAAMTVHGAAH